MRLAQRARAGVCPLAVHTTFAIDAARAHYREKGFSMADFRRDLAGYLRHGCVISTHRAFVMARPVRSADPYRVICDTCGPCESPDCWYIHVFCGPGAIFQLFNAMPFALPLAGWRRGDGVLRFYDLPRLQERFRHGIV